MSNNCRTTSVLTRKKSVTEEEEHLKNQRRTLQIVQVLATDNEHLTGRPVLDKLNRLKSTIDPQSDRETLALKRKEAEGTSLENRTISEYNEDDHEVAKKRITEKDLTNTDDKLSEYYWERLAIKRQEALDITLEENQQLQERIGCLRDEIVTSQKLFEESKNLVEMLTQIFNDEEEGEQSGQKDTPLLDDDETNSSVTTNSSNEE
uniref:Geminin n=1 Tax=Glossina morsitans morsitans TaxID=37546 RepID=A0A1B0FFB7_GLOMM